MNTDNTCMYCDTLITDTNAPARFCSQACFDFLLNKVKAQWDQRFQEAKANGNGANGYGAVYEVKPKPLSEMMKTLRPAEPTQPSLVRRV